MRISDGSSDVCSSDLPALAEKHAERDYAIAFSRIENHYFANNGFLAEDQLIRDAGRRRGIPAVIVQGRYDMATPPVTARDLHRARPEAEVVLIQDAGHAVTEPGILHRLNHAPDRLQSGRPQ